MPSCGVRLFVHSVKTNKDIFKIFHHRVATPFLFFHTKRHGNTLMETPPNGCVKCRWGRQKSWLWADVWLHCMLWTLRRPAAIDTIVGQYLAIERCLLELVLSTGRLSNGVSQSRCKSVYGTESHTPVNMPKRREHNLICAAVNLMPEYN